MSTVLGPRAALAICSNKSRIGFDAPIMRDGVEDNSRRNRACSRRGALCSSAFATSADRLLDGAEGRDDDYRSFAAPRSDGGQNLVPGHLRHLHVGDDQVNKLVVVLNVLKRNASVRRRERLIARFLQQEFHQVAHVIAVLDDQRTNISDVLRAH